MERSLQIHKLVPVLIEPDKIGLDIEAALTESDEGDEGVDFAVPNVTFEVRIGIRKVYEKKSDAQTGQFVANNVDVGEVEPQFDVMVSATDEVVKLNVKVKLDATSILSRIKKNSAKDKIIEDSVNKTLAVVSGPVNNAGRNELTPEDAEAQRILKIDIKDAFGQLLKRRYFEQKIYDDPSLWVYFDGDDGKWKNSSTEEVFDKDDYRLPHYKYVAMRDVEKDVKKAFEILVRNDDHPLVRRGILDVVKQHSEIFLDPFYEYCEAKWAEMVLLAMSKDKAALVLKMYRKFYKYDWAKNILLDIAKNNPDVAFKRIELYEYQPWAGEVAMIAAASDPESAIKNYDKYRDQPWAEEVLEFATSLKSKI